MEQVETIAEDEVGYRQPTLELLRVCEQLEYSQTSNEDRGMCFEDADYFTFMLNNSSLLITYA